MQKKYKVFFILIFIIFNSCKQTVQETDIDGRQVKIDKFSENFPESKIESFKQSEKIVRLYNDAETYSKIAYIYYNNNSYDLASYYFKKSAEKYLIKGDKTKYAEQLANIGVLYEIMGLYTDATEEYLTSLKIFNDNNDKHNSSKIYNNLGIVYQHFNNFEKALKYYRKSISLTNKTDSILLASKYNNIGTLFEESLNNYDSALFYYNKAYKIYKQKKKENLPIIENNIANIYLLKNDLKNAEIFLIKAYKHNINLGSKKYLAKIYRNQAKLYISKNEMDKAKEKILASIETADSLSDEETELESTKILISIYEKEENYYLANKELKKYYNLKDKLTGIEQKVKLNGIETKYLVAEKEHKINLLELNNKIKTRKLWILWLFTAVLLFLLIGLFLFLRLKQKQNKLDMLKMRRKIENYITEIEETKEYNAELISKKEENIKKHVKKFGLTEREENILILISKGYTNNEIAEELFVSVNTIKTHTKNLFIKLDVRNRTEAAKKAQN